MPARPPLTSLSPKISEEVAAGVTLGSCPAELDLAQLQRVADLARAYKWLEHPAGLGSVVVKGG